VAHQVQNWHKWLIRDFMFIRHIGFLRNFRYIGMIWYITTMRDFRFMWYIRLRYAASINDIL
jgi:hypothetical protein